jgi:thioredoxin:protein disulfide reductase
VKVRSVVRRVLGGGAFVCVIAAAVVAHAQLRGVTAALTPILEQNAVPGRAVRAALQVALPQGFHVQSNKPRDPSLIPTVLTLDPPPGVTVEEIVFPTPVELKQAGVDQPLAVYEQTFSIGVRFMVARSAKKGDIVVPAHLRYQACNDTTCFAPKTADTAWTLHAGAASAAGKPQHPEIFGGIAFGHGERPGAENAAISATAPHGAGPASSENAAVPGSAVTPAAGSSTPHPETLVAINASLQSFDTLSTPDFGGYLGSRDFLKFVSDAEHGVKRRGLFEGRGPLAILLIVFLGGLALNLTPCVLPMIPINLSIIGAGAKAGSRARGFLLGGVYGAAMALVYGVLGVVVILTAGTFGTINASPWFNVGIAILFVVLGLAMFDVVTIDFSRFSSGMNVSAGGRPSGRGTFMLAFGMGAIAALLAGACVAPVVIQVILFSSNLYAKGTTVALALPFLLGIGMAVPWPIAGAGLAALPKPGAWMVRVKQVLGVIILATAAYYGYEAYGIFANRAVDPAAVASSVKEQLASGWHASLAEGLDTARREQKPVLIDMWATWCKNCLTMDQTTMKDPEVVAALDRYVRIKFQAEDPDREPAKSVMQRFGIVGLPAYVVLRPKN